MNGCFIRNGCNFSTYIQKPSLVEPQVPSMHQLLSHVVHLKGGKIKNAQLQQSLVVQLIASLVSLTKIFRAHQKLVWTKC